jgi:hypothetical protein
VSVSQINLQNTFFCNKNGVVFANQLLGKEWVMRKVFELEEEKFGFETYSVSNIQLEVSSKSKSNAVILTGLKSGEGFKLVVICPDLDILQVINSNLQEPRYNFSVSSFENKIVFIGGEKASGPRNQLLSSCELLEFTFVPLTKQVEVIRHAFASLNEERNLHGSYITKENGKSKFLYVLGGKIRKNEKFSTCLEWISLEHCDGDLLFNKVELEH